MNIILFAYYSCYPVIGGGSEVISNLTRVFKERGHDVFIITERESLDIPRRGIIEGAEVLRCKFPVWSRHPADVIKFLLFLPLTVIQLRKILNKFQPDVINVHVLCRYSVYPLFLSYLVKVPFIISIHGADVIEYPNLSLLDLKVTQAWYKRAKFVTSCSQWLLEKAKKVLPEIQNKSLTVENGVNLQEFDQAKPFEHPRPFIFSLGRFIKRKGFDILIRAFRHTIDQIDGLDLIIAGDGLERSRHEQLIEELGMQNRVYLLGYTERTVTASLFRGCEFFVMPSLWEPFGIVNLEAMASKKAIVATRVGGVLEFVRDGINGIFVQPGNIEELSRAIVHLYVNQDMREDMGSRGRKIVEERYSWEHIADNFLEVYQKVLHDTN